MQLYGFFQDLQQGDDSVTIFMYKEKVLFDELVVVGQLVLLENFNLYVFRGLRVEFKDLVTSLVTKVETLSYANLHSYLLTLLSFFTRPSFNPWVLLLPMLLYCPSQTNSF